MMNNRSGLAALGLVVLTASVGAQQASLPQTKLTFEDRTGPAGHTLVLEGKSYGPYREVTLTAASTSGTSAAFVVARRDRLYVLAQGKESGPLPAGFEVDRLQVADDGKVWVLTATKTSEDEAVPNRSLLWVNGKSYGPYAELTTVDYSETGGLWIAAVRTSEDEADVLISGKSQGPFFSVDHAWLTPDGKAWGYAVSDSEGRASVVTSDRPATAVLSGDFTYLYPREPHWGYSVRLSDEDEKIVVDGQSYEGYLNFGGLLLTPSGRHWGFEAVKLGDAGDLPVVVVDGKEYTGESLNFARLGLIEFFSWTVRDGSKVTVQTLRLP